MKSKNIILDRDGVINIDSDDYIKTPNEWVEIENSISSIVSLQRSGWNVSIATNQSGIGRGLFDLETLNNIHAKMIKLIKEKGGKIPHIKFCPHLPSDNCNCRKPKPGLFLKAQEKFNINIKDSISIGDNSRDLIASKLIGIEKRYLISSQDESLKNDLFEASFKSLYDCSEFIKKGKYD